LALPLLGRDEKQNHQPNTVSFERSAPDLQLYSGARGLQDSPGNWSGEQVTHLQALELVADCMDWAKHRRRKAAAKTHMRLNLQSLLPSFVIIDTAGEHDNKRARELCAGVKSGEIVFFDKGYVDFGHLGDLDKRGAFWVTRAKDNMAYGKGKVS
jgi:hypothetical protein